MNKKPYRKQRRDDPAAIDGRSKQQDYGLLTGKELGQARRARVEMLRTFQPKHITKGKQRPARKSWAVRMAEGTLRAVKRELSWCPTSSIHPYIPHGAGA